MDFKLTAPGAGELQVYHQLPAGFTGKVLPLSNAVEIKAAFGNLVFQNYKGEGFEIWYSNYFVKENINLLAGDNAPVLELHIQFRDEFENNWDGIGAKQLKPYQYNITFTPFLSNQTSFAGGTEPHTFDIHFSVAYLQKLAPHFPVLDTFLNKKVEQHLPGDISQLDRFLTPAMIVVVNDILNCPYKNGAASFFLECKVVELLLLILDHVSAKHPLAPVRLSPYDIEQLHEARRLVISDFENPLSILQLSRKIGINDFKLKKGFKYLFGATVFNYMNSVRMEKAKQLLLETATPVEDIAMMCGFEFPTNFKKAFKRHFGYTPAYLRKNK